MKIEAKAAFHDALELLGKEAVAATRDLTFALRERGVALAKVTEATAVDLVEGRIDADQAKANVARVADALRSELGVASFVARAEAIAMLQKTVSTVLDLVVRIAPLVA